MAHRRGSFLLACFALATLAMVVAFAFTRNLSLQFDSSRTNQLTLLAREAAMLGSTHATEQILRDYATATATVNSAAGTQTVRGITFLDGPYRAPFQSYRAPSTARYYLPVDYNAADADKDVTHEHPLVRTYLSWNGGDSSRTAGDWFECAGSMMYDGRGRHIEPEYYNVTRQLAAPVTAVSFVNMSTPAPERSQGLFLDPSLIRVRTGDAMADRATARYRLRYAVGVEDLGGHLLVNPRAEIAAPADYRNPPAWVAHGAYAFSNVMGYFGGCPPAHWEHVFQGRGWFMNVDRKDTEVAGAAHYPLSFPLMYRFSDVNNGNTPFSITGWSPGLYASSHHPPTAAGGRPIWCDSKITKGSWHSGGEWQGVGRYQHAMVGPILSWLDIYRSADGNWDDGSPPVDVAIFSTTPYGRPLRRPADIAAFNTYAGRTALKWYHGRIDNPFHVNVMTAPPAVTRAMINGALPRATSMLRYCSVTFQGYGGKDAGGNDTWPMVEDKAINQWDPANTTGGHKDLYTKAHPTADALPLFPYDPPMRTAGPGVADVNIQPDYYADSRSVVNTYPGPMVNGDPAVANQGKDDLGERINTSDPPSGTSGGGVTEDSGNQWWGHIYASGRDIHRGGEMAGPFMWARSPNGTNYIVTLDDCRLKDPASVLIWTRAAANNPMDPVSNPEYDGIWDWSRVRTTPPDWWWKRSPTGGVPSLMNRAIINANDAEMRKSYYMDLTAALGNAIAAMRAQWLQYENWHARPGGVFPTSAWTPAQFATVRDLDRLFLAQLGESLDAPGTGSPSALGIKAYGGWTWDCSSWDSEREFRRYYGNWQASHNIKSLIADDLLKTPNFTSAERGRVMELILNDWRMSFLGCSPEYSDPIDPVSHTLDPAKEFRPLDFDGDGFVQCSCYQVDPASGRQEAPAAGGRGPKPPANRYFSISGCFFVGKSRFYRIWSRGQVYDNFTLRPVQEICLESAVAVDPEAAAFRHDLWNQAAPLPIDSAQVLFQRWLFEKNNSTLSRVTH